MPLISVVVPIYNVERYLAECLESLAQQTHRDLEIIMVDDGSTDSSAAIARRFAQRDGRFQLVQQPNGGLGNARNTGADVASGDFIAFVDSDDVVVRNAYELLISSLQQSGSDFASGNYHRLTQTGTWQSAMVAGTFTANRIKTHVTKHPALLNDRTAWNKLFRRSFWTEHGFRWPEGVLYEDIPVTLPAHVLASSVDVLRQPIYLWRARAGDSSSITQRRTEPRAVQDRTAAVDGVSRFLAEQGQTRLKKVYDRSVAEQDLRYFLAPLDQASPQFRELFLDLANDYFDRAEPDVFDPLPAIHRLQWHLVRRRLTAEVLEVLRFEKSGEINWTPVIRKGRRFYGDYPFRGDPDLGVPDSIYRLDKDEIPLRGAIEDVRWDGDDLLLTGWAHVAFQDLSKEGSARIRLTLEESGHPENVVAMTVRKVRRPDVTESATDGVTNYDWSGFEARVPVRGLTARGAFRDGHWRLRLEVRAGGIVRRRWLARTEPGRAKRPPLKLIDGARVVPTSEVGDFAVEVSTRAAEVTEARLDGSVLEVSGLLHRRSLDPADSALRVAREDGTVTVHLPAATAGPATASGHPFLARIPLDELSTEPRGVNEQSSRVEDQGVVWDLALEPGGTVRRAELVAAPDLDEPRHLSGVEEFVLRPTRTGRLRLVQRHIRPEVQSAQWTGDGELQLAGSYREPSGAAAEMVLLEQDRSERRTVPMTRDGDRFSVRFRPPAMQTVAGPMPLSAGQWDLYARLLPDGVAVRVKTDRALLPSLPAAHYAGSRRLRLLDVGLDDLALMSGGELPARQRGHAGRARLRTESYSAYLRLPRREAVLVDGYPSGQVGGDARAIFAELARRDTGLDIVWSVVDGQAVLPEGVRAVPRYGAEWYEALARSRYVVAADVRGLAGLARPPGQRVLQTWHGVPVAPLGLLNSGAARLGRGWEDRLREETAGWDVVLSTGWAMTEVMQAAFEPKGEIRQTGLPRHDLLVAGGSAAAAAAERVRGAYGIPAGARTVLYTPTYRADRPHRRSQRHGLDRFRFELDVEADTVRGLLGDGTVLLVRPHPKSVDAVPEADGRSILDVGRWPDAGELLLAADALLTEWSSVLVDYALLRRPMVLSTAAGGRRAGEAGGPTLSPADFPGPVCGSTAEALAAAVAAAAAPGIDSTAYARLLDRWVPVRDGSAAARAVAALLDS